MSEPSRAKPASMPLDDGGRVAVIGGGPAGSFFSYFLLDMARRMGQDLRVDLYEPKDYNTLGPGGCNHCGGILSESLVQTLAAEGINLPADVVQRGIDSYVMHLDVGTVRIDTPLHEKRIGAVNRGGGPRGAKDLHWRSFDGFLLKLASDMGARVVRDRVCDIDRVDGRPRVRVGDDWSEPYDLLVVAIGINSPLLKRFAEEDWAYKAPRTTKTCIREFHLGPDAIDASLGSSMHVFLPNTPGISFAAIIPKGDFATLCLLGEGIDPKTLQSFVESPEVRECMPPGWNPGLQDCRCGPRMNIRAAPSPYADRVVFVGDCGVSRLYKDGIGAAYRTAKAAARTVVFHGVSAADFAAHYAPACRKLDRDNLVGKLMFMVTEGIQRTRFARVAVMRMTEREQRKSGSRRRMSLVLWDMFTGSAPYREIFLRTLHPAFLARLAWENFLAIAAPPRTEPPGERRPPAAAARGGGAP